MENYSKSDLEDLLDGLPISLWLKNSSNQYIYANKCFCDSLKLKREEILGKTQSELANNYATFFLETSDKDTYNSKDLYNHNSENEIIVNGSSRWIKSYQTCIKRSANNEPLIAGIFNDISSQKQKHIMKYTQLENQLRIFLDTATDLYCVLAYDGSFQKVNSKFFEYLGWDEDELYKMKYQDLIHPDDYESSCKCRKNAQKNHINKGYGLINRYCCKNGDYKYFRWNWNLIESDKHIIMTGKNVTEEIKLKKEKKELEKNYELETLKTNFFANISHEFRTPINIILTTIQLLSTMNYNCISNTNKENFKKYCNGIKQNSYRLLRLVNNLLEMTKIDQGYSEYRPVNCNIVNLIEDIVMSVADYIENKNRQIIFDTTDEEIITACDPNKIETIILNLISNSLKFTDDNGIIKVNITNDYSNKQIKVSVQDNGTTIDKEYASIIFERFTQIDDLLSRPCEGSGLGLALAKSFVDLHNGTIWANTDYTNGAEIIFTIPITTCSSSPSYSFKNTDANIERFNVEFSDIYNLN